MNQRRLFLGKLTALFAAGSLPVFAESTRPHVQVYKSATCGCCIKWVAHMRNAGFEVTAENVADVSHYKATHGVPLDLSSCHTAIVEGYVVEGHVPADDVIRLLREKPEIDGIAVPNMPMGSPGMEGPNAVAYDVITFKDRTAGAVFATHAP
jgi:hypothetical protein